MWSLVKNRFKHWAVCVKMGQCNIRAATPSAAYASTACWGAVSRGGMRVITGEKAMNTLLQAKSMKHFLPLQGHLQGDKTQRAIMQATLKESVRRVRKTYLPLRSWSTLYALRYQDESTHVSNQQRPLFNKLGFGNLRWIDAGRAIYHGLGKDCDASVCQLCLDIGANTTRIFAYMLNEVALWHPIAWGSQQLDQALMRELAEVHLLSISPIEAEKIKWRIGSVHPLKTPRSLEVGGVRVNDGIEKTVYLEDNEVRDVLIDACEPLVLAIRHTLGKLPVALLQDVEELGICVVGGGGRLAGLSLFLNEHFRLPFQVQKQPEWRMLQGGIALAIRKNP